MPEPRSSQEYPPENLEGLYPHQTPDEHGLLAGLSGYETDERTSVVGNCSATSAAHVADPYPQSRTFLNLASGGNTSLPSNTLFKTLCWIASLSSSSCHTVNFFLTHYRHVFRASYLVDWRKVDEVFDGVSLVLPVVNGDGAQILPIQGGSV